MHHILFTLCFVLGFVSAPVFAESSVAPDFTLRDINKKKVSLSDYKAFALTYSKIMDLAMTLALAMTWPCP